MWAEAGPCFEQGGRHTRVLAPIDVDAAIRDLGALRTLMARQRHDLFSRDEWAYLIQFMSPERLHRPWQESFGVRTNHVPALQRMAVPAQRVALWLPNNVSLLGCLSLVLLSLTGAEVKVKCGSRGENLAEPFAEFARKHLPDGSLRRWFSHRLELHTFGREDPRNRAMSEWADARIFFGGDDAARAVGALPSRIGAPFFAFGDKVSEAWVTPAAACQRTTADNLAKVFSIYGQAGCTSPKRAVIVGGTREDALALIDNLRQAWESRQLPRVAQAQASEVVMAAQWARADSLETHTLGNNAAVMILSPVRKAQAFAHFGLQIQWGSLDETVATAASNLQTIGRSEPRAPDEWLDALARTPANRMVPLGLMHDFGHVWDGREWWAELFRMIET